MAIKTIPIIQRQQFFTELGSCVNDRPEGGCLGLLTVDISDFKRYNRCYGYGTGDVVLANVYNRLSHLFSDAAIFRIGDNEFSVILREIDSPAYIAIASQRILDAMDEKIQIADRAVGVNLFIGIAYCNDEYPCDPQSLVQTAERSLFYAKKTNKSFCLEVPEEDQNFFDYIELEADLLEALYSGALHLEYQPKVELATDKPVCAEALLRWNHDTKGNISPPVIVELANRLGKELELGKWILNTALREFSSLANKLPHGTENFGVAVNVPSSLIHESDFYAMVMHAINLWGVDPALITLEISEEAIIEGKEFGLSALNKLREHGIKISIDDFGTGYSSLNYFKSIPADEVKIDQTFIGNMLTDSNDANIVRLCLEIANIFKLDVVAEGVESGGVIEALTALNCSYAQGYFYTEPLMVNDLAEWLNEYN